MTARHRIASYAVWEVAVLVLNVLAFALIGLQLRAVVARVSFLSAISARARSTNALSAGDRNEGVKGIERSEGYRKDFLHSSAAGCKVSTPCL